jgi:S-DNA-T family DNA segregation ATPase FtsK/SpoIIIE
VNNKENLLHLIASKIDAFIYFFGFDPKLRNMFLDNTEEASDIDDVEEPEFNTFFRRKKEKKQKIDKLTEEFNKKAEEHLKRKQNKVVEKQNNIEIHSYEEETDFTVLKANEPPLDKSEIEPETNIRPQATLESNSKTAYQEETNECINEKNETTTNINPFCQTYKLTAPYKLPNTDMLNKIEKKALVSEDEANEKKMKLQATLDSFAIDAIVSNFIIGPRITLYELEVAPGVKVESITQIAGNIAMELCAKSIRILAPIPGRPFVGVEIPNNTAEVVGFRELLTPELLQTDKYTIPLFLGKDISGENRILDLTKAPHLLIAGATGSGKSVCLNSMLMSLLYKFTPEELRLILVDPKVVEFTVYSKLPHLIVPVVTEVNKVIATLQWVVREMEERYKLLAKVKSRNLESFNNRTITSVELDDYGNKIPNKLPRFVVVIDELADIMMTARAEVELYLARLAQLSRAVGIHLIVATQSPSVNVITGVIKANFPTRIAFQVSSLFDSRTILDSKGAESLLGQGDMLFAPPGSSELVRIQSPYIDDNEIERITAFIAPQAEQQFNNTVFTENTEIAGLGNANDIDESEDLITQAIRIIIADQKATTSYLQRRLKIGYNKAASLIEELENRGIIGPMTNAGGKREIFVDQDYFN